MAEPYARLSGGVELSGDEAIDYSKTDDEVDGKFTNLETYMRVNHLSVDDLMEAMGATDFTQHLTNSTTNLEYADIFTTKNATNTFTETTYHITPQNPMIGHLDDMNPVHFPYSSATGSEPMPFGSDNGSSDENMETSPIPSLQAASYDLDPDGEHSVQMHTCAQ